jgi:hypothetical protein
MTEAETNPEMQELLGKQIQLSLMEISNRMIEAAKKAHERGDTQRRDDAANMARTIVLAIDHMDNLQQLIYFLYEQNKLSSDKIVSANERAMSAAKTVREMVLNEVLEFV